LNEVNYPAPSALNVAACSCHWFTFLVNRPGEVKFPLLTPEMIKAQFSTGDELCAEMEALAAEENPAKKE